MHRITCCLLLVFTLITPHVFAQNNCLDEDDNNEVTSIPLTVRSDLYRGQQAFTLNMLRAILEATPNENIFFSPYSTYHALLLAYFGAANETERELVETLQLQWAKSKNHVYRGYSIETSSRHTRSKKMPLEFASADKIFFDKSIHLKQCMTDIFFEELESMNFSENAEQCRQQINSWIANVTRNELPEVLTPSDVTAETQMILANAAYFKGKWANQFDPNHTTEDPFYTTKDKVSFVKMMHKRGTYNLARDEGLQAELLQMPYLTAEDDETDENSNISMIVILPVSQKNNLENVLSKLTPDTLETVLKDSMAREVDVSLPKFKFEKSVELVPILRKMGINSIFDHNADFSGFTAEQNIVFGDAKHVAKIKVDEEGSTAAAATVLFSFRSARPIEPAQFKCNHPFLFLIYDRPAKAILFAGIYRDPMTQE